MTKNKDNNNELFSQELIDYLQSLPEDEAEEVLASFFDTFLSEDDIFSALYEHKCPDYSSKTHPLAPTLQRLWDCKEIFDEYPFDDFIRDFSMLPPAVQARELNNYCYHVIIDFNHNPEPTKSRAMGLIYVFAAMSAFNLAKGCLPTMLECLRQSPSFLTNFVGLKNSIMSLMVYELAADELPILQEFMREKDLVSFAQLEVCKAVGEIALQNPSRRAEVLAWFDSLIDWIDAEGHDELPDFMVRIDYMLEVLVKIQAVELRQKLREFCLKNGVTETLYFNVDGRKNIKDVINALSRKRIANEIPDLLFCESMNLYLMLVKEVDDKDDELDNNYDEDDYHDDKYSDGYEVIEGFADVKEFTVRIELMDCHREVSRTVVLPSNLSLLSLDEIVISSMGWNGSHLSEFVKGTSKYYCNDYDPDVNRNDIDAAKVAVGEVLKRKGSWILHNYDFGDSWQHKVTVIDSRAYKPFDCHVVKLLSGVGACPPDDCGGVYGYKELCDAMKRPNSKAAKKYTEWLGYRFNPNKFDVKKEAIYVDEVIL